MKNIKHPITKTIIYGLFCGLSFVPLSLALDTVIILAKRVLSDSLAVYSRLCDIVEPLEQYCFDIDSIPAPAFGPDNFCRRLYSLIFYSGADGYQLDSKWYLLSKTWCPGAGC